MSNHHYSRVIGISSLKLSKIENIILEAELFSCICMQLKEHFKHKYTEYFYTDNYNSIQENIMIEENFIRYIIDDILLSEEYSLEGIAYYTNIPEDVICDVIMGKNTRPSLYLSQKLMELHRLVKPYLYKEIMQKVITDYIPNENLKQAVST